MSPPEGSETGAPDGRRVESSKGRGVLKGVANAGVAETDDAGTREGTVSTDDPLYTFDLTDVHDYDVDDHDRAVEAYERMHLVSTLQGNVNRDAARLLVEFVQDEHVDAPTVDEYWLRKLRSDGDWLADRSIEPIPDLDALLTRFRDHVQGAVVYDPGVHATSNVASTAAGVEDLVAIRYDTRPGSLYRRYVEGENDAGIELPVRTWLVEPSGSSKFTGSGVIPDTDRESTGSAKCDAYLWAKENYLDTGRCNPGELGYYLDAYWLEEPTGGPAHSLLLNHDYVVANRGFVFDLSPCDDVPPVDDPDQPLGTDRQTMEAILRSAYEQSHPGTSPLERDVAVAAEDALGSVSTLADDSPGADALVELFETILDGPPKDPGAQMNAVHGFVPWVWKYTSQANDENPHDPVPVEWEFVQIASAYSAYVDADAYGFDPMANATLFSHYPLEEYLDAEPSDAGPVFEQNPTPTLDDLRERGFVREDGSVAERRYVAFYVGDYDSAAWLYRSIPRFWDDSARGEVPLSWAFNPNLENRMAPALAHTRRTRTDQDYFVSGDNGAGYLNPSQLTEPRSISDLPGGLEEWTAHCRRYFHRWDLSATGFVIDGHASALDEAELDRSYGEFSPDGAVGQDDGTVTTASGMPYLEMSTTLSDDDPVVAASALADAMATDTSDPPPCPEFVPVRTILRSPTWHADVMDAVHRDHPNAAVEFVDYYTLLALVEQFDGES